MNMEYLDMVVNETMRHYPLAGEIERVCTKDYTVPGTNFTVPKGMTVQICASGIMMDERYYPNPSQFTPENFSRENKEKRNPYSAPDNVVLSTYDNAIIYGNCLQYNT